MAPDPRQKGSLHRREKVSFAAALGILIVTAVGIGSYLYHGRSENEISSIAVMPFVNESGSPEGEYLSDGITETLISSLSQLTNLNVSPTSSVFRYKGKETDVIKIRNELGVNAVIRGGSLSAVIA